MKIARLILMLSLVALPARAQDEKLPKDISISREVFLDGCSPVVAV